MLLTITTTHQPATDIGYLLHKNPSRCQSAELSFGKVHVYYPEANTETCTAAILLDIDPVNLIRGRCGLKTNLPLDQYVNDRPYVCSSFTSVALSRVFGQTLNGVCKSHPELVETNMPLVCTITVLPCRGGHFWLQRLFEPLGYDIETEQHKLDHRFPEWGRSEYYTVRLSKITTVCELFNHLYVLIPVLDNRKHYYVSRNEIDKLILRGTGWLADHPERESISKRYLKHQSSYAKEALARLTDTHPADSSDHENSMDSEETTLEETINLNDERLGTVLAALKASHAKTVVDLGCGEGKLLSLLLKERQFHKIVGMDVTIRALEIAAQRLHLSDLPSMQRERIDLLHGSLMYRDRRIEGYQAASVVEVIEHLDPPRLQAFERVLFEFTRPLTIVLTTPNREYNAVWDSVGSDQMRHGDHRFEWSRNEFAAWTETIGQRYGYQTQLLSIGPNHELFGSPTQMCIFRLYDGETIHEH